MGLLAGSALDPETGKGFQPAETERGARGPLRSVGRMRAQAGGGGKSRATGRTGEEGRCGVAPLLRPPSSQEWPESLSSHVRVTRRTHVLLLARLQTPHGTEGLRRCSDQRNVSTKRPRRQRLTQGIRGVDLEDQPAVDVLLVGAEDGEDGALLSGFREEPVHEHRPLGEDERFPGLPFIGAVSVHR